jgi:hypothetical protein
MRCLRVFFLQLQSQPRRRHLDVASRTESAYIMPIARARPDLVGRSRNNTKTVRGEPWKSIGMLVPRLRLDWRRR